MSIPRSTHSAGQPTRSPRPGVSNAVETSTAHTGGRFFMLPALDLRGGDFAVPGTPAKGTGRANFALVPSGWTKLYRGALSASTRPRQVWITGRTQANGVKDYDAGNGAPERL
jgi:hypothetical protein